MSITKKERVYYHWNVYKVTFFTVLRQSWSSSLGTRSYGWTDKYFSWQIVTAIERQFFLLTQLPLDVNVESINASFKSISSNCTGNVTPNFADRCEPIFQWLYNTTSLVPRLRSVKTDFPFNSISSVSVPRSNGLIDPLTHGFRQHIDVWGKHRSNFSNCMVLCPG